MVTICNELAKIAWDIWDNLSVTAGEEDADEDEGDGD